LLAAAGELFYDEGVQSVGIDKVIERAGVAKASLYANFSGKDDLVRAYLVARQQARREAIEKRIARFATPREKLLAVFDALAESIARPGYRGCPFLRASSEMPAEASGREVCREARQWTRQLFSTLAREAGAAHAPTLARQLQLLYDGTAAAGQLDRDPGAASHAKAAAELLIDVACGPVRMKRDRRLSS
jgi:AcrR family transcriptional regulator